MHYADKEGDIQGHQEDILDKASIEDMLEHLLDRPTREVTLERHHHRATEVALSLVGPIITDYDNQ